MARQPRNLDESEWFHVYNRGHDRQDIFSLPGDHELFESLIGSAVNATAVAVHAYALLTNHFHLLVHAPDRALSDFAHVLFGRYASAYNERTNRTGAVFGGRFGSVPVSSDEHLLVEARYVERNPLAFVPASALANYRHSSLGCYVGRRRTPNWLTTSVLVSDDYERFVLDDHASDRFPLGELDALDPIDPAAVLACTAAVMNADPAFRSGPGRNLAAAIALELRVASTAELAPLLGLTPGAVRQAARRGRISVDTDATARSAHDRIIDRLRRSA